MKKDIPSGASEQAGTVRRELKTAYSAAAAGMIFAALMAAVS